MTALAYLDASAIAKLVLEETESPALRDALAAWPDRVSSALALVECHRAARRRDPSPPPERVDTVLAGLTLIPLDLETLRAAAMLRDPTLRALDAIHLATAASLREDLGVLVAYDERLLGVADALGLPTAQPTLIPLP